MKAANSDREALLYRVEFSASVANLREGKMERRNSSYFLFVVDNDIIDKQIATGGWSEVKICRLLEKP